MKLPIDDFLVMKYGGIAVPLAEVVKDFFPHLSKSKMLEKARNQEFPFTCFRLDGSQKAPYFVNIYELAKVIDDQYLDAFKVSNRKY